MLTITPSKSAQGAANYFDDALSKSDYYCANQGLWHGSGAQRLGLTNEVSRDDFVDLVSNRMPGTENALTVRTKENRIPGYDFCFSVPKSVSLYLAETDDRAVERMIHEAFKETMADIESNMETRVRGKGEDGFERAENRTTGNMLYASFVHRETRPEGGIPDCHFHIHSYVLNATFDETENRWKAGKFRNLKANGPFYEASFNARLAEKLVSAGIAIRRTERNFEIASVSRELIDKFSRRTVRINKMAREQRAIIEAEARLLAQKPGMSYVRALAKVKAELGGQIARRQIRLHPSTGGAVGMVEDANDSSRTRIVAACQCPWRVPKPARTRPSANLDHRARVQSPECHCTVTRRR